MRLALLLNIRTGIKLLSSTLAAPPKKMSKPFDPNEETNCPAPFSDVPVGG